MDTEEDIVLDTLYYLHAYGELTEDIVDRMSIDNEVNCRELCKTNGITYELND